MVRRSAAFTNYIPRHFEFCPRDPPGPSFEAPSGFPSLPPAAFPVPGAASRNPPEAKQPFGTPRPSHGLLPGPPQ